MAPSTNDPRRGRMTLVVARRFSNSIHLVSDTKLSFSDLLREAPLAHGTLKVMAHESR